MKSEPIQNLLPNYAKWQADRNVQEQLRKHGLNFPITQQIWYNRKKTKKQEEKRNEPDDIQRLCVQPGKAENEAGRIPGHHE